jgi:hypothetical protein
VYQEAHSKIKRGVRWRTVFASLFRHAGDERERSALMVENDREKDAKTTIVARLALKRTDLPEGCEPEDLAVAMERFPFGASGGAIPCRTARGILGRSLPYRR